MSRKMTENIRRISATVPDELLQAVDQWRRHQPVLPNFSEALRRLVEAGLECDRGPIPRKKEKARA